MTIDLLKWDTEMQALERGETKRYNHTNCPAGTDTKRRLYLTRPIGTPGLVLAFCHNCQESGVRRQNVGAYRDFDIVNAPTHQSQSVPFDRPTNLEFNVSNWPTAAVHWRIGKSLSISECELATIAYDPNTHRIYLPQYDRMTFGKPALESTLLGYQLRQLDTPGPKYLTAVADGCTNVSTLLTGAGMIPIGYVVEDLASGIALNSAALGIDMNPHITINYGTKINPEALALNHNISHGIVWLDNDSEHVKEAAETMAKVWNLVTGKPSFIERMHNDPKDVDKEVLFTMQKEHMQWKA